MSTPTGPPPSIPPRTRPATAPSPVVTLALGVRFLTELALMAAAAWAGAAWTRNILLGIALGVVAAVVVAVVWSLWIAPASRRRLPDPARLLLELVLFGAAAAGLVEVGRPVVAGVVGIAGAVMAVVVRFLPKQPTRRDRADEQTPPAATESTKASATAGDVTPTSGAGPPLRRPRGRDRSRPRG